MGFIDFLVSLVKSPLFLISIAFWVIAFLLIKILGKKRENVTLFFPFLIMIRSKKLNKLFHRIAKKAPRFWKVFWNIGVVLSFCLMLFALYFFISNFIQLIVDPQPENAIMPLIPGVTIDLPMFTAIIVPLLITITAHEFSHAIAAETDGVHVKSSGIMGAGIFFIIGYGAFVEVDEFQLNSKTYSSGTRLRVASAGIWSNIILAGIAFLLLSTFLQTTAWNYETQGFQIDQVLPNSQGGYNENNLVPGDIVYQINGTVIDNMQGPTLTQILMNQTDLQCSPGDHLVFTCYDPETRGYYNRTIVLGVRAFVGFEFQQYNNTAFQITNVFSPLEGGNNYNPDLVNQVITQVNGSAINYANNNTFEFMLTQYTPDYTLLLTTAEGTEYEIDVNYFPYVATAYVLRNVFIGMNLTLTGTDRFMVETVLSNSTENGINEGRIPEGTTITHINGTAVDFSTMSLKDFIETTFNPQPGDILIFTDTAGTNYTINTSEIAVIPTYVGITSQGYWIPRTWFGRLLGSNFPNKYYEFILYIWMVSFSLALFNLLPTTIFDGGRMVKEVINKIVGAEYDPQARKMLRYEFDPKSRQQHLFTHHIHKIHSCKVIQSRHAPENQTTPENQTAQEAVASADPLNVTSISTEASTETSQIQGPENEISSTGAEVTQIDLPFKELDTSDDGYFDTIELTGDVLPEAKEIVEVDVEFELDLKEKLKQRIYRTISWITGGIVLGSLIISVIKFNDTFFWL